VCGVLGFVGCLYGFVCVGWVVVWWFFVGGGGVWGKGNKTVAAQK